MQDYLHEIKDASDLRNHLINTRNFQFTWHLPSDEVLIWKRNRENPYLSRHDEFLKGMIKECPESKLSELGINSYEDLHRKLVCLSLLFLYNQLLLFIIIKNT